MPNLRLVAVFVCWVLVQPAWAQDPKPDPAERQKPPGEAERTDPPVREVGGRLVVSGETVLVTADPDAPPRDSSVASKVDAPLIETPRSVSITDRRTLDDLSAINISQAHDYTVGFAPLDERGPASARGFPVDFYDLRRDGLRTYSWSVREPVALDRVQYLHGPASVLYGDGSPGGLVNLVLKKPLPVPRFEVTAAGGELGFGRVTGDATGPLVERRAARYRLIGAGEWLENGFDNGERRLTFMPMLSFDVSKDATLTVDTELYHQRGRNYRHTIPATAAAQRGDFSSLRWDLGAAAPFDGWTGSNVAPGARFDLALGRGASLHVAGRYTKIDGEIDAHILAAPSADGRALDRFHVREISAWREYQSDSFATFAARTGRIAHRLVTGFEAGFSTTDTRFGAGAAPSLDVANPDYGAPLPEPDLTTTRNDVLRIGAYVLDEVRFTDRVIVVPSLRWSRLRVDDETASTLSPGGSLETEVPSTAWSPSLGLVVLPRPWLSFYATFAQGFEPPTPGQYLEDGRALTPMENDSIEGGVKADYAGRFSATAAAFRIARTNVAEADPRGFYSQIGEATSHGVELEGVGTLARGLVVRAGYAWTDTAITRDTGGFVGRDLPNAPPHKANLWVRYRFGGGPLDRLMVGAGVVYVADRFTASNNVVVAPAYTRADATASYEIAGPRLILGLSAQNLTNRRYVTSGAGRVLYAGPPRRIAIQLGSSF